MVQFYVLYYVQKLVFMRPVTVSDLRSNIKKYFSSVVKSLEVLIVPTKDKDDGGVIIMSVKQYNSLCETSYLLSTSANREALRKSISQLENGEVRSIELEELPIERPVE